MILESLNKLFLILIAGCSIYLIDPNLSAQDQQINSIPYTWKSVQIVGGGFVDGIIFHPTENGLCYCRTDMGGAYRRNPETLKWEPLLDWLSYDDLNLMGVESIALDPSNPEMVFLSCGTYSNSRTPYGAILRSDDRGNTFSRTDVPFKMGGNEDGRGNGERMAVDPNNGSIIYLGTRHDGLWKSIDRAVTWNKVESFPDVTENPPDNMHNKDSLRFWRWMNQGCGINLVIFDPKSGAKGKPSSTIYVGVSLKNRENFFYSHDTGKTWKPVSGQPIKYRPTHAVLSSDGNLYITYGSSPGPSRMRDGGVWKYNIKNGTWTDISPDKPDPETRPFGYAAVSVDKQNPTCLIVSSYNRYEIANGEDIFRSTNGGKTWKQVFLNGGILDSTMAPYTSRTGIHWLFDIEIDPFNSDHAMFTTGFGGYETFNLSDMDKDKPTTWSIMSTGIEETVGLDLHSPPKGAQLISAIGDYGGFVHWDLDKPSPEGNFDNPRFGNTNDLAFAENNPDIMVRVGNATNYNPDKNIGYSLDGGKSWQPTNGLPYTKSRGGSIAVSSDGNTWIWSPARVRNGWGPGSTIQPSAVYFTVDKGNAWNKCNGVPNNTRVVAAPTNSNKFYAMNLFDGKFFISMDGGENFSEQNLNLPGGVPFKNEDRGDSRGGQDQLYVTPGRDADLWIAAFDALYHSIDEGTTFIKIDHVDQVYAFGFGKNAPDKDYPAIYLIGTINGVRGVFCSVDVAESWTRINDDQHQWGLLLQITGDPKLFGRVYIGTHGRGILYGDPVK